MSAAVHDAVRYGRWIAIIVLIAGYALLAHHTNTHPGNETIGTLLALSPIALAMFALAWNARHRSAMLAIVIAGCVALAAAWSRLEQHYSWIYWIEHAGTQLVFGLVFARTLAAGREPMCSYFARMVHGSLTPDIQRYTRQITIAWVVFFGAMAATSTILFFFAPVSTWSAFVNFFTIPLVCLMFVLEYGARRIFLPDMEHVHILAAVTAMWKSQTGSAHEAPK
jgi:uncharacterized membrane protein